MNKNMKNVMHGCMIIAAVLCIALIFSGAAGAEVIEAGTIDAVQSAINDGKDVQLTADIIINSDSTLDLKGKTVKAKENTRLFTVPSNVTFTLMDSVGGGKLTGNGLVPTTGAGVFVNGTFIMNSGNIVNCTAGIIGGGVIVNNGTFEMNGGTIADCSCNKSGFTAGGGVGVYSGMFIMNGGTIKDCSAKGGGAVYIYNESTFTMLKGTISDCTAVDGGGVGINNDGKFVMDGGEITRCKADNCGGGVQIYSGRFAMNNGKITECSAEAGGAVHVYSSSTFVMVKGNIEDCSATHGGGVAVNTDSKFILEKGSISRCTATYGGGVHLYPKATLIMNNGDISYCTATSTDPDDGNGGGVAVSGTFEMNGGTIVGCKAASRGGGVYVLSNSSTFTVKGPATIKENFNGSTLNNVYLEDSSSLKLAGTLNGTIGIAYPEPKLGTPFGTYLNGDAASAQNLVSDITGHCGAVNGSIITWAASTSKSPAPFVGIIAGLGIAGLVLARLRK